MNSIKINDLFFGLVFFTLVQFSVLEIHFIVYFFILVLCYSRVSKNVINSVSFLVVILLIGCFSSLFQTKSSYDLIKDLAYFIKPILSIFCGYLIAKKINNLPRFLATIIWLTFIFSLIHIFKIVIEVDFKTSSISEIRRVGGISNIAEVFVLVILIVSYKHNFLNILKTKLYKNIILSIIIISFLLYFSRTMFVTFIILILAVYGYLKITPKGIKYGLIVLILFGSFYAYLFSIKLDREKPGLESFLYKIKIAPSEIFSPPSKIDANNHAQLWDHWRAYEASKAIEQINNPFTFFFGKGLGSLVDLKIKVLLGDEKMRYIPVIHNGYVNLFFKTGILGAFIYFLFLLNLYLFTYVKNSTVELVIINNLIAGIGVYFLFSSLIINGVYNYEEIFTFFLGSLLYYKKANFLS